MLEAKRKADLYDEMMKEKKAQAAATPNAP